MALELVPIDCIKLLFEKLYYREHFQHQPKPTYDCFLRNYIEGISTTRYQRELWSCYISFVAERNIRTNSVVEGWH